MARFSGSSPSFHGGYVHDDDDDARSTTSSVASYFDAINPPLTARLPPTVRPRSSTDYHGNPIPQPGSGYRLTQLEDKLAQLEQQDWKTDRLILSADRHHLSTPGGRPTWNGSLNSEHNGAHSAHRPSSPIRTPSRYGSHSGFGSPFSASDSIFQTPSYTAARPANQMFSNTPGVHSRLDEIEGLRSSNSALKRETDRLRAQQLASLDSRIDHIKYGSTSSLKYSSTPVLSHPRLRTGSPLQSGASKQSSSPAKAVIDFYDIKYLASPEKRQWTESGRRRISDAVNTSSLITSLNSSQALSLVNGSARIEGTAGHNGASEEPSGKRQLAQNMLDHLLGQYFRNSNTFCHLLTPDDDAEVVWVQWWPVLEKEVRQAIKPEMKAVYDSRCSALFSNSKATLQECFRRAPDQKLAVESLEKCAGERLWSLLKNHPDAKSVAEISGGGPMSWEEFWQRMEDAMKAGVKDHVRLVVKEEILAQLTEWRGRFNSIFKSVDKEATGRVPATTFVEALARSSSVAVVLGLSSEPSSLPANPC